MRIPLFKRLVITFCNIFFPPLAVMLLTGANEDFIFNCVMFLLAVIPSHIHGFYVSLTYFNRKGKVRRGVYPGPPKHLIWSERVNNGGASWKEVERLKRMKEDGRLSRRVSRRVTGQSDRSSSQRRVEDWDNGPKEYTVSPQLSRMDTGRSGRSNGQRQQRRRKVADCCIITEAREALIVQFVSGFYTRRSGPSMSSVAKYITTIVRLQVGNEIYLNKYG
ncbi:hypothetical protein LTR20_010059 [Exophiala xenobiotica]|nr:hypothetical protein LTS13_009342 [Exophiala xenobiotica]KAK5392085.1 hypothetical protein LTR79_010493 [Exophiala xenobiotica]KAK5407635.1 hypothetical protein LTR90_009809 [Exophiala xenobiotica]KAK5454818.1 hypothetical protein LTR20_010059 [Exophiala xenobiotica]KAK5498407.1 hypothetical protein LTR26_001810 [Exophiala xenobiotica]